MMEQTIIGTRPVHENHSQSSIDLKEAAEWLMLVLTHGNLREYADKIKRTAVNKKAITDAPKPVSYAET